VRPYVVAVGSAVVDEYYACDSWPAIGDKAMARHVGNAVGGMVPNAASVMSGFDMQVYLLDRLGDDADTHMILQDLQHHGIRTDYVEIDASSRNSKTLIVLTEGERTILVVDDPDRKPLRLDDERVELLLGAQFVYTLIPTLRSLPGLREAIVRAQAGCARLVLDVESASFADREADRDSFELADVICFNERAFEKYSAGIGKDWAFERLLDRDDKLVAVTLGAQGCLVRTVRQEIRIPGIPVTPVDTTGAGDTFIASLMYGLSQNWELQRTAAFANAAAARSVLAVGPKAGIAPAAEIEAWGGRALDECQTYRSCRN